MLIACRLNHNILRDDQKVSWRNQAWLLKNTVAKCNQASNRPNQRYKFVAITG
jgi:hypothetical protein